MASHFLGGSFTYRHIQTPNDGPKSRTILVEIRFHLSNHYFICTPEQVNEHTVVYLLGDTAPYDAISKTYQWFDVVKYKENKKYYNIECQHNFFNGACSGFQEKMWGYCESANQNSGYSILRRQFLLTFDKKKPVHLKYLNIEKELVRNNSSPYPHIPASYYVDINKPTALQVFAYDADGDEIICQRYDNDFQGFLTVHIDSNCKLSYRTGRLGRQFGQFWLIDRRQKTMLSKSLISIQVHVLSNIVCNTPSKLIIKHGAHPSNEIQVKIQQSVYLTVSLHPNCQLIQPQDQTITELTTLCTNNQPVVLADGGIATVFQCTPSLCEKYQVCFVGEFGLKLPSTKLECLSIQVVGEKNECALIASKYDFVKPRSRQFIISQPESKNLIEIVSTKSSTSSKPLSLRTTEVLLPLSSIKTTSPSTVRTSASSTPKSVSKSRSWLWISATLLLFFGFGLIGYYGLKPKSTTLKRHSLATSKSSRISSDNSDSVADSDIDTADLNARHMDVPAALPHSYDDSLGSPSRVKVRAQHVRLGPFDDDGL